MRRLLLRLWLGSNSLGAMLALAGCHGEMLAPRSPTVRSASVAVLEKPEPLPQAPSRLEGGTVPTSYRLRPALEASCDQAPAETVLARAKKARVERIVVCKVEWQVPGEARGDSCARVEPARLAPPVYHQVTYRTAPRPAPVPVTSFSFAQAARPGWMVGELVRGPRGGWCVRCAAGGLALLDPGPMAGFHSGQLVRVEGRLVEPGPHELEPSYAVRAIQALSADAAGQSGNGGGR